MTPSNSLTPLDFSTTQHDTLWRSVGESKKGEFGVQVERGNKKKAERPVPLSNFQDSAYPASAELEAFVPIAGSALIFTQNRAGAQ